MIEEGIIEWLDLGDSVQKIDIYLNKYNKNKYIFE